MLTLYFLYSYSFSLSVPSFPSSFTRLEFTTLILGLPAKIEREKGKSEAQLKRIVRNGKQVEQSKEAFSTTFFYVPFFPKRWLDF